MSVILLTLAAMMAWGVFIFNRLVRDRNRVRTAWSDIDVQLKRRHDLIPKLVSAVDAYARHERATLTTLTVLRSRTQQTDGATARGEVEAQIGIGLRQLVALAEAYPELKADENFLQLQGELTEVENQIQYARRFYNGSVRNFNIRIASFPDLLLARLCGYTAQAFFELTSDREAHPPEWPVHQ